MLLAPNGAIAMWASSGLTRSVDQLEMYRAFTTSWQHDLTLTIGESILRAKQAVRDRDTRRTWQLFGDPTTPLNWTHR